MSISGFLPPNLAGMVATQQEKNNNFQRKVFMREDEDYDDCLARRLVAAIEEYKEKVLRGLNALTDNDIKEKLEEFEAAFAPEEPATQEEILAFALKFSEFALQLEELRANQGNTESLLTSSASNQEDYANQIGYMRSQLPANPQLQQQLAGS